MDPFEKLAARLSHAVLWRLSPFELKLKRLSAKAIQERGAEPWFRANPLQRAYTRRLFAAAQSMCTRHLPCHDVGCGIGQCIAELSRQGFSDLYGCDVNETYIRISHWLLSALRVQARLTACDGPAYVAALTPASAGTILMLNWTYRLTPSEFGRLLDSARSALSPGGVIFLDIMRRDWRDQMGTTEELWCENYRLHWRAGEAESVFAAHGLRVLAGWGRFLFATQLYALTPAP